MNVPVYLDYNATTPVDPRVVDAMLPYLREQYGNPSSKGHAFGWAAEEACEVARERVAALLGADTSEITFTSCATESVNQAIKGLAPGYPDRRHIITTRTEHNAVLASCRAMERDGFEVTYLPVDEHGVVRVADVEAALRDDTLVVAIMWANNETGSVNPIREIGALVRKRGVLLMTDATQAIGKLPVAVDEVDLLACSAHKFYGPKGVGALYVRKSNPRIRLSPLLDGGGHEGGLRSGTLNVSGIVGMGLAAELAAEDVASGEAQKLAALRDRLEQALLSADPAPSGDGGPAGRIRINGMGGPRMPQTTSVVFPGVRASDIIAATRDLAFSAGSACASGSGRPSHVLKALGLSDEDAFSTLRISLGRFTTEEEIDFAVERLKSAVASVKKQVAA